jgi:hypothetical protein
MARLVVRGFRGLRGSVEALEIYGRGAAVVSRGFGDLGPRGCGGRVRFWISGAVGLWGSGEALEI